MSGPFMYTPATYELPPYYTHPHTPQRSPFIPPSNLFPSSPYTPPSPFVDLPGTPHSPSFLGVPLPSIHNRRHSFGHGNRAPWPYPTSSQNFQIHPLLNGEAYVSEFYFDIANPAFAPLRRVGPNQTAMISVEELREPATFPTITSMRITHDAIPQWPIRLASSFMAISHSDWAQLSQSEENAIARAYTRRYRSIPSSAQLEASQGVKRVDYLTDRHVFRGLVRAADEDGFYHWKLLT
ncbi:uncharacterized protein EDB91DRAFT_1235742 [Suillus paluster]|uniref:uncharacterized protein n=1 Tax=Suillus paluster TaxID=48578 RepID=UPI001B8754A0|nr:uncharacterized protein EDB91DRAFT_1235742 [Suillus paluster]KAG1748460.1 hypothetical protein EDB91DRAFT_1235742 [Suillus paluster]